MEVFHLTLRQMLMMFSLMLVGFFLQKKHQLPDNTYITLSKLETYVITPALTLSNMITNCTVETFQADAPLMFYGLILVLAAISLAYPLSKLFIPGYKKSPSLAYQRSVYKYALTFANYGFVGNFIIMGVWGQEMFYKYSLFVFLMGIICQSWGLYVLIPKDQNASMWANLKKGLTSPPIIALAIGITIGLLGAKDYVPAFLMSAFEKTGSCQGPIAMLLAGLVIGRCSFKELFKNPRVYLAAILRLVVLPGLMILALKAFGVRQEVQILALVAFGTPLGLNTIVYPATYGGDTHTGAAMTMVSQSLSIVTLPLMYLLLIQGI